MPMSTSELGARTELAVASALTTAGFTVFIPFFNAHSRVDLVYQRADGVRRVQCKSGRLSGNVVGFYTCSHTGGVERGYIGEVEDFGVYCESNGLVYLVPVVDVPSRFATLRLAPARNNQVRGTRDAALYVVGRPW